MFTKKLMITSFLLPTLCLAWEPEKKDMDYLMDTWRTQRQFNLPLEELKKPEDPIDFVKFLKKRIDLPLCESHVDQKGLRNIFYYVITTGYTWGLDPSPAAERKRIFTDDVTETFKIISSYEISPLQEMTDLLGGSGKLKVSLQVQQFNALKEIAVKYSKATPIAKKLGVVNGSPFLELPGDDTQETGMKQLFETSTPVEENQERSLVSVSAKTESMPNLLPQDDLLQRMMKQFCPIRLGVSDISLSIITLYPSLPNDPGFQLPKSWIEVFIKGREQPVVFKVPHTFQGRKFLDSILRISQKALETTDFSEFSPQMVLDAAYKIFREKHLEERRSLEGSKAKVEEIDDGDDGKDS